MHLIWSALWGAFPREVRLISEFLIPSLRAKAIAPHATPREVEEERPAGPGGGAQLDASLLRGREGACQVLGDTATFENCSRPCA